MTSSHPDELLRETLAAVAPGTELRDGLERILRGRTGALIVLGLDPTVEQICSGGFALDVDFSATRLRELSKMDGAVVLDRAATRIRKAAVQLLPDPTIETTESGTRHRTAERVAKQTGFPIISVSQSMRIVALYVGGQRHVLEDSDTILGRANQALATLERYRARLDEVSGTLSALEIEDLVTVRDVCSVVQRLEMVGRISDEIAGYVIELGVDGRLLALQLDELIGDVGSDREFVIRDYVLGRKDRTHVAAAARHGSDRPDPGPARRRGRARRGGRAARLPAPVQGAAPAEHHHRAARRPLQQPAEAPRRERGRPHVGRRCRRAARPDHPRGPVAARGVEHPRAVRLTAHGFLSVSPLGSGDALGSAEAFPEELADGLADGEGDLLGSGTVYVSWTTSLDAPSAPASVTCAVY
jgi:DNA integrity scanning protein DisA with diadenylate cyclase activity